MGSDATDNTMRAEFARPAPEYFPMPDARKERERKAEGERRSPARFAAYTALQLQAAYDAGIAAGRAELEAKLDNALHWKDLLDAKKALGARLAQPIKPEEVRRAYDLLLSAPDRDTGQRPLAELMAEALNRARSTP